MTILSLQSAYGAQIEKAHKAGEKIDYLTFVPDGEPTLDADKRRAIELVHPLGIKIAVISNGSLIWCREVQDTLMQTDWVSLKVDSVEENTWRKINRPHADLNLRAMLTGIF